MEALRPITPAHLLLLRSKPPEFSQRRHNWVHGSPIRPFVSAKLSKQTAEISREPQPPSSSENGLAAAFKSSPEAPDRLIVSPESLQYPAGYVGARSDHAALVDGYDGIVDGKNYRRDINLASKLVYDVAVETPLHFAPKLSKKLEVKVWLKREDLQLVFSFKLRGAYNMMVKLEKEELKKGVICSSAGNHAQGVALAAKELGCDAVIVMPVTTPEIKWQAVEELGAEVVRVGDNYDEAQAYAKKRGKEEGRTFIPPFDHPDVISGQGTVGMEIVRQMKDPLHAIFVPVGGGGLIAGIAAYVKSLFPEVKIIGVEPTDANAMALSLHHGERVILDRVGDFADGVAVKEVGEETFRLCRKFVDGIVLVSRDAICAATKDMCDENRYLLEPAGALALAGAEAYCKYYGIKGENIVAITSGANMNFAKLRVVAQRAYVGSHQEALLATILSEEPGSFKHFCKLVSPMNITEFKYRYSAVKKAVVLYSVGIHTDLELKEMQERMASSQLETRNITKSDLVKDFLRDSMGGRTDLENVVLCHFTFPERPGALMKFLDAFSPRWNICSFQYRKTDETGASAGVLVGIQVPSSEMNEFYDAADILGYQYEVVTDDEDIRFLMPA